MLFLTEKYARKLRKMKYEWDVLIKTYKQLIFGLKVLLKWLSNFKCLAAKHIISAGTLLKHAFWSRVHT